MERFGSVRGPHPWKLYCFTLLALAVGALLRLTWGADIEFKYDEAYMFERAMKVGISEPFPWVGMRSGAGTLNPGMSIWIFVGAARLFGIDTPPGLARVVQASNIVALVAAMLVGLRMVSGPARKVWLWAVSLACVNPLAVLLHRKIWAQSVLPLFCVLIFASWWRRDTRWGAFCWGLLGAWLGQVHMSGFFFAGSLWLWTWLGVGVDRLQDDDARVRWMPWIVGSLLGALTLLPWLYHLLSHGVGAHPVFSLKNLVEANFYGAWYWILWVTGALGLGISYSLGAAHFSRFLEYPIVGSTPSYGIACAHVALIVIGLWVIVVRCAQIRGGPIRWRAILLGGLDATDRLIKAGLYGLGLSLTLLSIPIAAHYLLVTFPLQWLWLSRQSQIATRRSDAVLGAVWTCQLLISVGFLYYIHVNHGAPTGDYGTAYQYAR